MAGRYIPPALRNKPSQAPPSTFSTAPNTASSARDSDLTRRRLSDLKLTPEQSKQLYTLHEILCHFGDVSAGSTLHDSAKTPGELAYVVLYRNANPRWYGDKIIYVKTKIWLLPGYGAFKGGGNAGERLGGAIGSEETALSGTVKAGAVAANERGTSVRLSEGVGNSTSAGEGPGTGPASSETEAAANEQKQSSESQIAIFMEVSNNRHNPRKFIFHGYYHITNVDFLKPNSPELKSMLEQKWTASSGPSAPSRANALSRDNAENASQWKSAQEGVGLARTKQRNPEAWAESLRHAWAVVKFGTVRKEDVPVDPEIKVLADESEGVGPVGQVEGVKKMETMEGNEGQGKGKSMEGDEGKGEREGVKQTESMEGDEGPKEIVKMGGSPVTVRRLKKYVPREDVEPARQIRYLDDDDDDDEV